MFSCCCCYHTFNKYVPLSRHLNFPNSPFLQHQSASIMKFKTSYLLTPLENLSSLPLRTSKPNTQQFPLENVPTMMASSMSINSCIFQTMNNFKLRSSTPAMNTPPLVTLVELLPMNSYPGTTGSQRCAKPLYAIYRTVTPV